jgi:hypothetical protein
MVDSNSRSDKAFSLDSEFAELFYEIGKILDRRLSGTSNPVIRDNAAMDALFDVRNILCKKKVIKSFKPIIGIEEEDERQEVNGK